MKLRFCRVVKAFSLAAVGLMALGLSQVTFAMPVELDMASLHVIQLNTPEKNEDQAYLLVNGVANGKEFSSRLPEKTFAVAIKKPVASAKEPVVIWKGDLADGEFAFVTVTLMQGTGEDAAKLKEYSDKKLAVEQAIKNRANAKATKDTQLPGDETLAAQQKFITGIKKIFNREAKTDHFGGLYNVLIWNNGGKVVKRIDPVGLTFGEHYGIDPKIYTKLKYTRTNLMLQDEKGEWAAGQWTPLNDDQDIVRVKFTEVEAGTPKKTIDYVMEVQVKANDKAEKWELRGEQSGPTELHKYWDYAE